MGWDTSARREVFANTVDERSATEPELKYIVRNNIKTNVKNCTSMAIGQLYRKDDIWMFTAIRKPFHNGLKDSIKYYGLEI